MKNELVFSPDYTREKNDFSFVTDHGARDMSHEEEVGNHNNPSLRTSFYVDTHIDCVLQ